MGDESHRHRTARQVAVTDERRGRHLIRRSIAVGGVVVAFTNAVAVVVVVTLLVVVLPTPDEADDLVVENLVMAAVYGGVALVVGLISGRRRARRRLEWLRDGRGPTAAERRGTIGIPFATARLQMGLWLVATAAFGLVDGLHSALLGVEVGVTVLIGGLVASASTYLLVERVNRPLVARALVDAPLHQQRGTGVAWRTIVSWLLGTALPVVGVVLLNGLALGIDIPRSELAIATFVLGLVAVVGGLIIMVFAARSIADPLKELRGAVVDLAEGRSDVAVPVSDAGEVGILQTAFNQMSAGLAERDRLRDLFGRHVGEEVARRALDEGVALGGEVRDVAVLFVDVTGSTGLAERSDPTTVVERLNHLFGIVLDVVEDADGTVTAFEGDAAVCVWGAPAAHPSPATGALSAARAMAARLAEDDGALPAGIGVAAGPVVAGNIGAHQRVEYTVIGDAVNTAARLSDLAKDRPGRVVADRAVVEAADDDEARCWTAAGEEVLAGRRTATALAVPA
ncbi:adenylate/guanylate cyclase domain-containing protein [Euzebya sp.]|uniref:adenylate/guanylate cyclase domain-containing protein n=1 Tax=Euzebya sp. TaxID=1971409 RepID=UPI0035154F5A